MPTPAGQTPVASTWNMRHSRSLEVTACLIVRNEETVLRRCLTSIAAFVDDICVIDSGSTDGTVDIARSFGATVVVDATLADRRGRMLDFASARNAALSLARSHWVLSIDADEVLHVQDRRAFRSMLASRRLHAIEVEIRSGGVQWYLPRFFARKPWTRWHERVHEWIDVRGPVRRATNVVITNLPHKIHKESAAARDLRLCRRLLAEDPDNLRAVLYLARAFRRRGSYQAAIPYYDRYSHEATYEPGRYIAEIGAATCWLLLKDYCGARRFALRAYRREPSRAEACCLLGDVSLGLGRPDLARRWFQKALTKRPPVGSSALFVNRSCYDTVPRARLSWIRGQLA
jgi:glycosyltransferase involved in cell wall biosynthesis